MNNVYFAAPVAALVRRIVNVFSTLSITHQYVSRSTSLDESPTLSAKSPFSPEPKSFLEKWPWNGTLRSTASEMSSGIDSSEFAPPSNASSKPPEPPSSSPTPSPPHRTNLDPKSDDIVHQLMRNPALYDPMRAPRYPIVLCHGLYGFDVRGPSSFPSLRMHYWSNVLEILRKKVGANVIVTSVPGTGSIASRSENLDRLLQERARGRGVNLLAHSMGGLDCRHLISHVKPTEYAPLSLTTISTPHRGSPFMDWCSENIGLGRNRQRDSQIHASASSSNSPAPLDRATALAEALKEKAKKEAAFSLASLPSSFTTLILSLLDSPAYANLTTNYLMNVFNPATPDDPRVRYFSVAGRLDEMSIWHPLWLPKMVLDDSERRARERIRVEAASGSDSGSGSGTGDGWDREGPPLWERSDLWGNDGLVSVQSARWGEFLGIIEGCDHWEIRGARGMDFGVNVDLSQLGSLTSRVSIGSMDGWSFGDWGRFVTAWKKEDQKRESESRRAGNGGGEAGQAKAAPHEARGSATLTKKEDRDRLRAKEREDPVIKASTDKLSAVFDWIVDHVPASGSPPKTPVPTEPPPQKVKKPRINELETRMDLERFYVALSRKLYDEGL